MTNSTKTMIATMISDRELEYENHTDKIFNVYGVKLKKAVPFLINYDRDVTWESIERYSHNSKVLCIYAIVDYKKDDVIVTQDGPKKVVIDGYRGKMRFLITEDSLENSEPLEIVEEVKLLRRYEQVLSPSESYGLFDDPDFDVSLSDRKFDYIKEKLVEQSEDTSQTDFDLSKLTKNQQERILNDNIYLYDDKGTVH